MLGYIYEFFQNLFYNYFGTGNTGQLMALSEDTQLTLFGVNVTLADYFAYLCSLISLIFIVVLCCLFVYKIIKLVGNLIR